ncbi:MAG TPA: hypothetical protein DDW49_11230 [Deltaproteobacteria bacterium]|nr:hypothetical protein [Deltaproteobacteria bacterium]
MTLAKKQGNFYRRTSSLLMQTIFLTLLFFTGILSASIFWAASPNGLAFEESGLITEKEFEAPLPQPQSLKIITYNIGYASGITNNQAIHWPREEIEKNLNEIAQNLKKENADIIGLQELDFDSKRTHGINQMEFLQQALKLPYAAYVITWNKRYLPWPYWPVKIHYGRMVSGQAVLSRYPITKQDILAYPKPASNAFWYNWFYLDRKVQKLNIQIKEKNISLWHAHLEAFDPKTCLEQAQALSQNIQKENLTHSLLIGDLNSVSFVKIPLSSPFNKGGKRGILEERKQALEWILNNTSLKNAEEEPFYTMPSWEPIKKIDHILHGPGFTAQNISSFSSLASDHLSLIVQLTIL